MNNSVILAGLVSAFRRLLCWYDASGIEKRFARVASFWGRKAEESLLLTWLRTRFMNGAYSHTSKTAALLSAPGALCRRFYENRRETIASLKKKSRVYAALTHLGQLPLRDIGLLFLSFGIGLLPGLLLHQSAADVLMTGAVLLLSLLLLPFAVPAGTILYGSRLVRFIRQKILLSEGDQPIFSPYSLPGKTVFLLCFFVMGLTGLAVGGLGAVLLLAALLGCLLILWKTEIGVYLFVPMAAVLPTMVLAGLVLLTVLSYLFHLLLGDKTSFRRSPFSLWIAAFLVLALMAALGGMAPASSLKIYLIYAAFTLAFPLITNMLHNRRDWNRLMALFVTAAAFVSLYGIFQNFFLKNTTQSWVDSSMFSEIETRVYSTLDNPNVLGEYLILLIPLAVGCLLWAKQPGAKGMYLLMNLAMFGCLMYTWSRGAWVGVVLALGFFLIQKDRRWLILCVAALLLMPSVLPASVLHRLTSIGNMNDTSTAYRVSVWQGSLRIIRDYWVSGIGLGPDAFLKVYPGYALNGAEFALHSHNFYLQWIVDMGVGGLVIYIGLILTAFSCILRVREENTLQKVGVLAMSGGLLGYLFHGMAENLWYNYRMVLVFWIYLAFISSAAALHEKEPLSLSAKKGERL